MDAVDRVVRRRLEGRDEVLASRGSGSTFTGWTSPPLISRRLASPEAETRSYWPPPPPPPRASARPSRPRSRRPCAGPCSRSAARTASPTRVGVAGPLDQVERPFALADRGRQVQAVRGRAADCRSCCCCRSPRRPARAPRRPRAAAPHPRTRLWCLLHLLSFRFPRVVDLELVLWAPLEENRAGPWRRAPRPTRSRGSAGRPAARRRGRARRGSGSPSRRRRRRGSARSRRACRSPEPCPRRSCGSSRAGSRSAGRRARARSRRRRSRPRTRCGGRSYTSAGAPSCSIRPWLKTAMRSLIVSASSWSWVT